VLSGAGCDRAVLPLESDAGRIFHRSGLPLASVYSRPDLGEILVGCNRSYLTSLSALNDFSAGARALDRLTRPRVAAGKTVKGINFFNPIEQRLLRALQRPAFNIAGIHRAHLLLVLDKLSPGTVSRLLTRLRTLGLIKRVSGTYRYYLTPSRQQRCRFTEQTIIPALA
jgi:hypothetical protein